MKLINKYMKEAEKLIAKGQLHEAASYIKKLRRLNEAMGRACIVHDPRFKKLLRDLARKGVELNK